MSTKMLGNSKQLRVMSLLSFLPALALIGCTCSAGVSQKQGAYVQCTTHFDPPASDLATLNVSQALGALSTQNLQIVNNSGTLTIEVQVTATGQVLGETQFGYNIINNSIYAQSPEVVHNWLSQFAQYGSEEVTVNVTADDVQTKPTITHGTTVLALAAQYEGVTYASASLIRDLDPAPKCPKLGGHCQVQ